jgi:hypothetical protein
MRKALSVSAILFAAAFIASMTGCSSGNEDPKIDPGLYKTLLYMTDTNSGKVQVYDPATHASSGESLASAAAGAGEIRFHEGKGYVCVGFGAAEGVYRFDPSADNPTFAKIGTSIAAQYVVFLGAAKGYISTYGGGLYSFDPSSSSPTFAAVAGTSGLTLQDAIVGSDGKIYVADYGNGKVIRLDPSTDEIEAKISASASGTTGLAAGSFGGQAGVFVANNGGYGASPAGSIDFLRNGAGDGSAATVVANALPGGGAIIPSRLAQLSDGDLAATGYGHTYRMHLAGSSATLMELQASASSFGSMDIAVKGGLVYVPSSTTVDYITYSNRLYVFDESGAQQSYSPVSVMSSSQSVTNIAFYED